MYNNKTSDYLHERIRYISLKLDMQPLLSGETNVISFAYDLPVSEKNAEKGIDDCLLFADVVFPEPIRVSGQVENMAGYMALSLMAEVPFDTHCARCMEPIHDVLVFSMEKGVANTKGDIRLEDESNDDYTLIVDGKLDVDESVLDQIFLEFPMKHLCREDCQGLCPKCGKNRNEGECGCDTKVVDPRFAKLKILLDNGAFSDEEHGD